MLWKSNAKIAQKPEDGSVFKYQGKPDITIHKYMGCGNALFLTCAELGIDKVDLRTEDFDTASYRAQMIIAERLNIIRSKYEDFITECVHNKFCK
jgi:hypothetical protein